MFDLLKSFYDNDGINIPCERQFYPYWEWEDWQAGIYAGSEQLEKIQNARQMLLKPNCFYENCNIVISQWPKSTLHRLTNPYINRKAWIGHSAAFFYCGANKASTREAYLSLSLDKRKIANQVAGKAITEYLLKTVTNKGIVKKQLRLWE